LALLFGAADQYLGSLSAHPLGADISGLSAPWLMLPFVAGAFQRTGRRAVELGALCTLLALVGYTAMTFSPIENAHLSLPGLAGYFRSGNLRWFVAGAVTGPLFGWLGHRWRTQGALWAGLAVAVSIVAEPWARHLYGNVMRSTEVAVSEMCVGAAVGLGMALRSLSRHGRQRPSTS
jgi:uncharacterized membrane protein (UPF0136 family)